MTKIPKFLLTNYFDAVVMLTWSNWATEPRSNRYHYAVRFARTLPVFFLQHQYENRDDISVETSEVKNIDLVNVSNDMNDHNINEIKQLLAARGVKRPLVWIYDSLHYQPLIDVLPNAFRVYHATEDYLTKTKGWNQGMEVVGNSVGRLLSQVDFMVACTEGVAESCLSSGGYKGPYAVIENGCDAEYFLDLAKKHTIDKSSKTPIAIFQGGVNQRLDYELILDLVKQMPDWEFRFCGASVESEGWKRVLKQENVCYLGPLSSDEVARYMCESTVGIIPYIQDQWIRNSLPLKAYEYVACGLPVVTVPIRALERDAVLIAVATTADEFESTIRQVADSRCNPDSLDQRRQVAMANSYNSRFLSMSQSLLETRAILAESRKRLKVAVLYDCMISMHVSTIREHLEAFDKYSYHAITYVPATPEFWKRSAYEVVGLVDFSVFDVVIIHYSIRLSVLNHLDNGLAQVLEKYNGLKVLFIQDEYEGTEIARSWMDKLKFDVVYTCVPQEGLEYVYPSYRFPVTEFLPTLTGYVPEDPTLERYSKPLSERELLIAYRGRKLPAVYGQLGYEKYRIGVEMKRIAGMRGLPVDIEVDDSKRIYGSAWYEFLGSARATLGTESGANVFDFDGSLRTEINRLMAEKPEITFKEISAQVLASHEGCVRMNQISPKMFEAIRLRTALVLFEGSYSGVIRPNEHYISLKKDFSNIDEILAKLKDDEYLSHLTDRAYQDVVASGKFSYRSFIEGVDADIGCRVLRSNTQNLLRGPLFSVAQDGSLKQVMPALPYGVTAGLHPLGYPMSVAEMARVLPHEHSGIVRRVWHRLPFALRARLVHVARGVLRRINPVRNRQTVFFRIARRVWHLVPLFARIRLVMLLKRS